MMDEFDLFYPFSEEDDPSAAYLAGKAARMSGDEDNPYIPGSKNYKDWDRGYAGKPYDEE